MQSNDEYLLAGQSPQTLLDALPAKVSDCLFRRAAQTPELPAARDHLGRCLNFEEMAREVRSAADELRCLGVEPGDRVMLVNENSVPLLILILALADIDACPVVINARMARREIERIHRHCEPRLALYLLDSAAAAEHWAGFADEPDCRQMTLAGADTGIHEQTVQQRPNETDLVGQGVFMLIYTTGTTGDPKGVMLTHRNVLYVAAVSGTLRGLSPADKIYLVLPVSHVFGLSAVFVSSIVAGAELIVADRFEPSQVLFMLQDEDVTGLFGVPAMFARLADHIKALPGGAVDMPHLRFMYSGGAPLDPAIKQKTEALFGIPLLNGYGMTESGPTICQVRHNEPLDTNSVGRPLPGQEIRVLGPDGCAVRQGEVGELHVRGPNVMLGYFRNRQATAAALDGEGFLNTGDLVRVDEGGNVHVVGRSKELIIHSGFNVYPPEVEGIISKHPQVLLCAVIGEQLGGNEEVVAWVQRTAGSELQEEELRRFIKPLLTAYKRPSRIVFTDTLPTAPSGKVLKHLLKSSR